MTNPGLVGGGAAVVLPVSLVCSPCAWILLTFTDSLYLQVFVSSYFQFPPPPQLLSLSLFYVYLYVSVSVSSVVHPLIWSFFVCGCDDTKILSRIVHNFCNHNHVAKISSAYTLTNTVTGVCVG